MAEDVAAPAEDAGAEAVAEEEAAELAERAAAAERRAEEYLAQLQRLKADFDNYRRRMMQEQARWEEHAVVRFLAAFLPVLDNLERALEAAAGADAASLRAGLDLVLRQVRDFLRQQGVEPIVPVGQPFDPTRHEAMERVEGGEGGEDVVAAVFQKGYLYRGTVVRPALVQVAVGRRAPAGETEEESAWPR